MSFKLKDIIFGLFGVRDYKNDINKDSNNKGFHQRFNELLAEDLDDNELELVNKLVENTQNPNSMLPKFIAYKEQGNGMPIFSSDINIRRKALTFIKKINQIKGTKLGFLYTFQMLGFDNCVINEIPPVYGFDKGTFDNPSRRFDQKCKSCSMYSIDLFGTMPVTPELIQSILTVVTYHEPINADLLSISYNGTPLISGHILTVTIDQNGDLIIINPFDSTFFAYIDNNGDLIIGGNFANFYSLDTNGDLIFTT